MNEMLENLKIDPEFEKVIPPLTKDEYHQLEENILDDGRIMMPIAVWGDIIVDGHNRYRIAREYGDIPFSTTQLTFAKLIFAYPSNRLMTIGKGKLCG